MYRLDAIPIEIPVVFFIGVEKILKCVWKHKRSQTDKAILRKTLELEVSCLLHIILQSYTHQYSMVLAQKQIHRSVDQNRAWNKPMNFLSVIYNKGGKNTEWGKVSSIIGARNIGWLDVK